MIIKWENSLMKALNAIAATAVAASSVIAPMTASADPGKGSGKTVNEYCKYLVDSGFFPNLTVGQCVSINRADGPAGICKLIDYYGLLGLFGFKNRGACVTYFRSLGY